MDTRSKLKLGDIVLIDNLASHMGKAVCRAVRAVDARLFFLPPYNPDLNPIEQIFAKLETFLRGPRHGPSRPLGNASGHSSTVAALIRISRDVSSFNLADAFSRLQRACTRRHGGNLVLTSVALPLMDWRRPVY